ncbi:Pr6Pr family membrane protein [Nocardioides zeae]|uniref:Pr6Pr family membrane protein n=1 Tax=Nocardioides imazamoxiresistens TaxID=3231893 RepID=A0ABU3PZN7_9ACTN|nr:Pr6Pr family membrane protein [Nocardioides zeae]MDT9594723.1 Pr6Pr family membrane protein [Nocardioides zeae]
MTPRSARRRAEVAIGVGRVATSGAVVALLGLAYLDRIAVGDGNPFDYFGYFTNQTNLVVSVLLGTSGLLLLLERPVPPWLATARGVATACLLVVAVIYNGLIPGTGTAPAWVSAVLHVAFPLVAFLDWVLVGDRPRLAWRSWWIVLPYPVVWLAVVLVRGATDGWVPYGFLLPERGLVSLLVHCVVLLVALVAAGAVVWATSRFRGTLLRRGPQVPA